MIWYHYIVYILLLNFRLNLTRVLFSLLGLLHRYALLRVARWPKFVEGLAGYFWRDPRFPWQLYIALCARTIQNWMWFLCQCRSARFCWWSTYNRCFERNCSRYTSLNRRRPCPLIASTANIITITWILSEISTRTISLQNISHVEIPSNQICSPCHSAAVF